jgi:hypothetical protein
MVGALVRGGVVTASLSERVGRESVVTACVQAANLWSSGRGTPGDRWQLVAELHGVVALAHLAHEGSGLPLVDFVDGLAGTLSPLLPETLREGCDEVPLIERGQLSSEAADLLRENLAPSTTVERVAEWGWESLRAEKIQGWLYDQLLATGSQAGYVAGRRAVIDHPAGDMVEINDLAKDVGLPRSGLYDAIPAWALIACRGEQYWFPCPICRWPMRFQMDRVSCMYPPHERATGSAAVRLGRSGPPRLGAWRDDRVRHLGIEGPVEVEARVAAGDVCLVQPVWRYSTIPGLEELHLARELLSIEGVAVEMWPRTDAYDLLVEIPRRGWRRKVDVKDYADPGRLGAALGRNPALRGRDVVIIVPGHRSDQVRLLNERLRHMLDQPRRRFAMTTAEFVRLVRTQAAGGPEAGR